MVMARTTPLGVGWILAEWKCNGEFEGLFGRPYCVGFCETRVKRCCGVGGPIDHEIEEG